MNQPKETLYMPVQDDEDSLPLGSFRKTSKSNWFWHFLVLEAFHLALILGAYALYSIAHHQSPLENLLPTTHGHELDTYFTLSEYNTIKSLWGNPDRLRQTAESNAMFERIQITDGIVEIDTEWAHRHNIAPSHVHPFDPTKSIYQIDMFHSIHCVYRLRNKLTSNLTLAEWPRDDEHTLHCLDYIKEQLMCNSDVVLQGTADLTHFNISNGHLCRSSDLITDWSKAHHWQGYRQYLADAMGSHHHH